MSPNNPTRRSALKTISAAGALLTIPFPSLASAQALSKKIKLGIIADLHGGLAVDADTRLDSFLQEMHSESCDALVQLGDFAYPNPAHQAFADKFNSAHPSTIHVIGNHDFDFGLTREDCYKAWKIESSYFARDLGGLRILVLDGNDQGSPIHDGGYPSFIGAPQLAWLKQQLENSNVPVVILSHQPLAGIAAVDNATEIQQLLGQYKSKIILCVNGHSHIDSLVQIGGVPFLHLNSASYYWVGGETRMAYYQDPLYSLVTIDPKTATVVVEGKTSRWKDKSPEQVGFFVGRDSPTQKEVTPKIRNHRVSRSKLAVMTWNIWGRFNQDPRYTIGNKTARQRMIDIVRDSGVDMVAMIETYGSATDIANHLGFHHHTPAADANLCIFSRYPLSDVKLLDGLDPFSFIAATVTLPAGQKIRMYNIWLTSGGRHIVAIKDREVSDQQFARGDDNRFEHLQQLLTHDDFKHWVGNADSIPVIVAGDFNCVSHLDHTTETRSQSLNHSRVLPIKVSRAMAELGFTDTYRAAHPQITTETLGHTWTTVGKQYVFESGKGFVPTSNHPRPEYQDPYSRIDYIYSLGRKLKVMKSLVISHHPSESGRSFPEFPSDHAAVVTEFHVSS